MNNAAGLLSKEEIAALTDGIEDGSIPVSTGYNSEAVIRKHDLTNEDSSLGVNVTSLDMINERFIRLFRLGLLEVLRTSPRINPSRVQLMKYGEYLRGKQPPLSVNVVRMHPLRGLTMVLIDTNVIFTSLDNFFGGIGKAIGQLPPGRLFTPTETRVINIILDVFIRSLREAWSPLMDLDLEKVSSEINPNFAQIADENDLVIVNHFDAECGDTKGFVDFVYPYSSLKPIRELLKSRVQTVDGDGESDKRWHVELESALGDAEVEIEVVLGQIKSSLGAIASMREGDVLFFRKPEFARLMINEVPAFEGQVGSIGPAVAIQIERILEVAGKLTKEQQE